jgi:hypothetical protein
MATGKGTTSSLVLGEDVLSTVLRSGQERKVSLYFWPASTSKELRVK